MNAHYHKEFVLAIWDRAVAQFRALNDNVTMCGLKQEMQDSENLARYCDMCAPIETAYGTAR